ncbi:putative pectinesterase/pectinesterase inhibitor 51 [Canna indica]|uniref:Pectinesterase/pectinesterase inhibitor 51 n=1 Tax=Canna indica TaxID=4628 RepID=A0AAQ3JNW5_9LILI|nr:putative pectinesterase/pectinesterase inhibitor 51 [Canna indica]
MASSLLPPVFFSLLCIAFANNHSHQHHRGASLPSPKADTSSVDVAIKQAYSASLYLDLCKSTLSNIASSLPANSSTVDLILVTLSTASQVSRPPAPTPTPSSMCQPPTSTSPPPPAIASSSSPSSNTASPMRSPPGSFPTPAFSLAPPSSTSTTAGPCSSTLTASSRWATP